MTRCARCHMEVADWMLTEPPDEICIGLVCLLCDSALTFALLGEEAIPAEPECEYCSSFCDRCLSP